MDRLRLDKNFSDLFETTTDLIHYLHLDGRIELVNPAWLNTLGYTFLEVHGKSIYDIIHPDFLQSYKECRQRVMANNSNESIETAFLTKNGQIIFGDGQIAYSFVDDKRKYTRCIFKNITESRGIEKKLIENENRLKTFFKRAPDAIIIIDETQSIIEWNPKAEQIFGYSAAEVMGNHLADTIIPHQYREAHKKGFTHFLKTGEGPVLNKTIEITGLHKTGTEFFISLSISNVRLEEKWVFIAFISDISERKRTEEELINKKAELLQSKVIQEKKDEFLSIASHELKTPLTTIKAFTQLALSAANKDDAENVKKYLSKADYHIARLNTLMVELLDITRIQTGKLILSMEATNFSTFLPSALNMVEVISATHEIILESNQAARVLIDVIRIEQVLTNLITNADKYSPGKKTIVVSSVADADNLIVSVKDFGIGIPSDKLDKLFTRFYRVDEHDRRFTGLGIGLFIASEIIKQHGGKISVTSKVGEGSIFSFSLPLIKQ